MSRGSRPRCSETEGAYDLLRLDGVELLEGASVEAVAGPGALESLEDGSGGGGSSSSSSGDSSSSSGGGGATGLFGGVGAGQRVVDCVFQYNHTLGTLHLPLVEGGASPVALAEIPALGRR